MLFITGIISFCIFFFGAEWIVTKFIKNPDALNSMRAINLALIIVLPCAFGMASLAGPIMKLLFPAEPATVGTILFTLTPCVIFLGLIQTVTGILQGMGKAIVPVIAL